MARGENEEEVVNLWEKLKGKVINQPKMVVMDFSPQLKAGTLKVFPEVIIGHDYFHTANHLNKGVLKELSRIQGNLFTSIIREFKSLRKLTLLAEDKNTLPSPVPEIRNEFLKSAYSFFCLIFPIITCKSFKSFKRHWKSVISSSKLGKWEYCQTLINEVEDALPACGFTPKNYEKYSKMLGQRWRTLILAERKRFEKDKSNFSKVRYLLLKKPENMEPYEVKKLRTLLKEFPFLRDIREGVVKFHYQFKANENSYRSLRFLKKLIKPESHPKMKAVINTLIKEEEGIFAYREMYESYPHLKKGNSIRSNNEHWNRKVNQVARDQYGFRSVENIITRVQGILKCPVIVSESLLTE